MAVDTYISRSLKNKKEKKEEVKNKVKYDKICLFCWMKRHQDIKQWRNKTSSWKHENWQWVEVMGRRYEANLPGWQCLGKAKFSYENQEA